MTELECQLIKPQLLLLNVGILLYVNYLLLSLKQQIDDLVAQDKHLQAFLAWVSQKSQTVPCAYKLVTVRAFYFDLAYARALAQVGGTLELAKAFNPHLTCNLEGQLALDLALDRALGLAQVVKLTRDPAKVFECVLERTLAYARTVDFELALALQLLKAQLPNSCRDKKQFLKWWEAIALAWTEELRSVTISHRNIGHDWQFSNQQLEALKHYYDANCWLVDCLNSACYMTRKAAEEIESNLLLPMAEIPY